MTLTIKLTYNGQTRKLIQSSQPSWDHLALKISNYYKIPVVDVAVSYIDSEGDQVTLSSQDELADYYTHFLREGETARFQVSHLAPPVTISPVAGEKEAVPRPDTETTTQEDIHVTHEEPQKTDPFEFEGLWDTVDDVEFPGGVSMPPHIAFHGLADTGFIGTGFIGTTLHEHSPSIASPPPRGSFRGAPSPRPPPAFIEVIDSDESDSEDSEAEQLTPKGDKGKGRDLNPEDRPATANSGRSLHGSVAPHAAETSAKPDISVFNASPLLRHEPIAVNDPPVPEVVHADPEVPTTGASPTVPSNDTAPPNIISDLTALLQGLTAAFAAHPELTEGVRNVIRNALNGTYLGTQRDSTLQAADQVLNQARAVSEDATHSVSNALQGVFDALNTGVNDAAAQLGGVAATQSNITSASDGEWLFSPPPPPGVAPPSGPPPPRGPPAPSGPPPPNPPPHRVGGSRGLRGEHNPRLSNTVPPFGPMFEPGTYGYPGQPPRSSRRHSSRSGHHGPSFWVPPPPPPPPPAPFSPPRGPPPSSGYPYYVAPPGPPPFGTGFAAGPSAVGPWGNRGTPPFSSTIDAKKEESIRQLNERKTQLEIAKEAYKVEKIKWKEAKDARRRERDIQIQSLLDLHRTGKRVLPRDERHRDLDEPLNRGLAIDNTNSPTGPFTVSDEVRKQQEALMAEYTSPIGSSRPLPRPTTISAPPPYGGGPRVRNTNAYTPLGDRVSTHLEEMGYHSNDHPRLVQIIQDHTSDPTDLPDAEVIDRVTHALDQAQASGSEARHTSGSWAQ